MRYMSDMKPNPRSIRQKIAQKNSRSLREGNQSKKDPIKLQGEEI